MGKIEKRREKDRKREKREKKRIREKREKRERKREKERERGEKLRKRYPLDIVQGQLLSICIQFAKRQTKYIGRNAQNF